MEMEQKGLGYNLGELFELNWGKYIGRTKRYVDRGSEYARSEEIKMKT